MEKIIIEVLRKQGRVQERHSFLGGSVKIGRGYSNDVILSDPFVSPDHVQISPHEKVCKIEDLN
ncbi:MAG: FHA domain-containing protein [Nitrospinota bacterium]